MPSEIRPVSGSNFSTLTSHRCADLDDLGRMRDPAPRHVGDVEEAVDPAEVDEGAVVGDVLDGPRTPAIGKRLGGLLALDVRDLVEDRLPRKDDVPALPVEADDAELQVAPVEDVEVLQRPESAIDPGRKARTPMSTASPP